MKKPILILGAALFAVLAGCAVPVKPTPEQQRQFEREIGEAVRARYWAIQEMQKPRILLP